MEYIVARSSHTRLCAGVPLCNFTSFHKEQSALAAKTTGGGRTSSREMEDGRICGMAAEGGAYGDGRVGTCEAMSLVYERMSSFVLRRVGDGRGWRRIAGIVIATA